MTALEALRLKAATAPATLPAPVPAEAPPADAPTAMPLRAARDVLSGMFVADRIVQPLVEATVRAQRPLTTGRRIVLIGAHVRAGVTATAVTLTQLLSSLRPERIALIGTGSDPLPIARRTAVAPGPSVEQVLDEIEQGRANEPDQVAALMPRIGPNSWAVGSQSDPQSSAASRLAQTFSRYFGATIIDAGSAPTPATSALLGSANAVVLTGDASREGMHALELAFTNIMATGRVAPDRLIISLVQTQRSSRIDLSWEADIVKRQGVRSIGIPWDAHVAAERAIRPENLATPTHRAFAMLMAEAIDTSMTTGSLLS